VEALTLRTVRSADLTAAELHAILWLRCAVFVVEQQCAYPDVDGRDMEPGTTHLWLEPPEGGVAAYVRLLREPDGAHRIGRVVTDPSHRGHRLAGRLIDHVLTLVDGPVVLDAQSHLTHVYARHGFEPAGDEFVEDGIPHTPMRLA
jgi:ElaA protein